MTWWVLLRFELRRRFDHGAGLIGHAVLVLAVLGVAVLGCMAVVAGTSTAATLPLSEVVTLAGLPAAVGCPVVGVVFGAADAAHRGNRMTVLAGARRSQISWSRLVACCLVVSGVAVWALLVAVGATEVTAWVVERSVVVGPLPTAIRGLLTLCLPSGLFGFVIGALVRSSAVSMVIVLIAVLVVDTALAAAGSWGKFFQVSALQSALLGEGAILPALSATALWIIAPGVGAFVRAAREDA